MTLKRSSIVSAALIGGVISLTPMADAQTYTSKDHMNFGLRHLKNGNCYHAMESFRDSFRVDDQNFMALIYMGDVLASRNTDNLRKKVDFDLANKAYHRAAEIIKEQGLSYFDYLPMTRKSLAVCKSS